MITTDLTVLSYVKLVQSNYSSYFTVAQKLIVVPTWGQILIISKNVFENLIGIKLVFLKCKNCFHKIVVYMYYTLKKHLCNVLLISF